MDARGWQQSDLAKASGLSRQRVSQLLADDRDFLPAAPNRSTVQAIARAFVVGESTVTAVVFEAMGYDLGAVRQEADLSTASTEEILRTLATRLNVDLSQSTSSSVDDPATRQANIDRLEGERPEDYDTAARGERGASQGQRVRDEQDKAGE